MCHETNSVWYGSSDTCQMTSLESFKGLSHLTEQDPSREGPKKMYHSSCSISTATSYKYARRLIWKVRSIVQKLYGIREPRCKQIKIEYQTKKFDIRQSIVLIFDVPYCFAYISASLCCTEMNLNLKHALGCMSYVTFKMGYCPSLEKYSLQKKLCSSGISY